MVGFKFLKSAKTDFYGKKRRKNIEKWFCSFFQQNILASCINIPYDVAKSRLQSLEGLPGGSVYGQGCHTVMINIAKTEGTSALFAGLAAKLLRLCPAGGVMMMMNEIVYDYLTSNWPLN